MAWTQTVAPTAQPLSITEVKVHLRVDDDNEIDWIRSAIVAARQRAETDSGLQLMTATWTYTIDNGFPEDEIVLDKPPIGSVSSVQYVDENGDTQTWAASKYVVTKGHLKTRIVPAYSETWPTTRETVDAVTVTFTAGYGGASAVPDVIKHAMKLLIGHWFINRESTAEIPLRLIPQGYRDCLAAEGLLELV